MRMSLIALPLLVIALAAALIMLGGPGREFTTDSNEAYELFRQGYYQVNAYRFAAAESSLLRAVELDPEFVMARATLASAYSIDQRKEEAQFHMAIADSLVRTLGNDLERAKVQLTLCSLRDGDQARRDSLLAFLESEEPDNLIVLSQKAQADFNRAPEESEASFRRILEIEPNYAHAYNYLGYLAARDGRYEEAETHLRKYAFLAPGLANPHDSLGEVLTWLGKYDEAEKELLTALEIDATFHYSLVNLGNVYLEQGMVDKGERILEDVRPYLADTPREREIDQILIRTYYTWDFLQRSRDAIARYVERYDGERLTEYYRAVLAAIDGDVPRGRAVLDSFLVWTEKDLGHYDDERIRKRTRAFVPQYDAMVASLAGDHAAAARHWTEFNELTEEDTPQVARWWVNWRLGEALLASGDASAAADRARMALDPNPNRILPLLLMAESALELDQRGPARELAERLAPMLGRADANLAVQTRYQALVDRLDAPGTL